VGWQDFLAMGFVAAAAVVVAVRAWKAMAGRGKTGCGSGCGTCGNDRAKVKGGELLEIGAKGDGLRS
jgi:hypothetical protein